ncbi:MAG: hypothetical protein IJN54_01910 [Lachnospiraceae bacterium]|nr:hypothetical protein [Lachnospiraceae bacterium]
MKNKTVKFNIKLIQDNKVYLPLSDVVKALGYKRADFINEHSQLIEKISGVQCIRETDYNNLLAENESALHKQGQIEITRIETLRSKIDSVMSFQGLKFALARDYLQMMAARTGCKSVEQYVLTHEIPQEKQKALQELMQDGKSNSNYRSMIEFIHDKERFDIDKIRNFGLDVQYLTSIDCTGNVGLDAYIVGQGVFHSFSDLGDYEQWHDLYKDDDGNLILPWCDYIKNEEMLINLSENRIDRDFRQYNAIENMIWCIDNLGVDITAIEDYEYEVFGCHTNTIDFAMPIELLVKLIKPNAVSTIYTDKLIDVETFRTITDFNSERVFEEDYKN